MLVSAMAHTAMLPRSLLRLHVLTAMCARLLVPGARSGGRVQRNGERLGGWEEAAAALPYLSATPQCHTSAHQPSRARAAKPLVEAVYTARGARTPAESRTGRRPCEWDPKAPR